MPDTTGSVAWLATSFHVIISADLEQAFENRASSNFRHIESGTPAAVKPPDC
ncbi:hypothetical protein [Methylobacillus sp. Pita1]|uniref:hypothetical protein n=1 Tax=Methylobacillus sp. Pita1 TaxID=3382642 RepID=UPI0038B5995F